MPKPRRRLGLALSVLGLLLAFQNCGTFRALTHAAGPDYCAGAGTDRACLDSIAATCTFNGRAVGEGQSVTAYLASTVATGESCAAQTRTCRGGALDGSYAFATCTPGGAAACLFDGTTVASGASVTAFLRATSATCAAETQTRTCANGVLSGSYAFARCASAGTPASCLFNGQTIAHGRGVTAFATSTVAAGQSCQSSVRVCLNGALSGAGEYATCAPQAAASCLFNGQTVAHGATVTAYAASTVPAGQSCQPVTRPCTNGTLSGAGTFASCAANSAAACVLNGSTIPSGGSVTAYVAAQGPRNVGCATETRVCTNGALSGSAAQTSCSVNNFCYQTGGGSPLNVCHYPGDEGAYNRPDKMSVAYGTHVFKLGPQNFRTIYHAQSRDSAQRGIIRSGDSLKAGGSPGPFTFLMPSDTNYVIWGSMTDPLSVIYYGPQSPTGVSGGANPMTIGGLPGDPHYYTFFLSVTNALEWVADANFLHFLNVGRTLDFRSYDVLSTDPNGQRAWHPFRDGVPDWTLRPANLTDTSGYGINGNVPTTADDTQGMIGSVTYAGGLYYYFYTDRDPANPAIMRLYYRTSPNISGGAWSPAALASDETFEEIVVAMVYKAKARDRWAVAYTCYNSVTGESDICLQYTANLNVRGVGGISDLRLFQAPGGRSVYSLNIAIKDCNAFALRGQLYAMTDTMGALASPDGEDSINRGGFVTWVDGT